MSRSGCARGRQDNDPPPQRIAALGSRDHPCHCRGDPVGSRRGSARRRPECCGARAGCGYGWRFDLRSGAEESDRLDLARRWLARRHDGASGEDGAIVAVLGLLSAVVVPVLIASVWSVIVRFRRASGDERQQLKWLTYGGTI